MTAQPSLPPVFLPYQQRLWRAVDAHGVTIVEKSRRTGYSWALAAIAAGQAALGRPDGGSDTLYMGYEKEMTREFIDYVADWAKIFQLAASDVEERVFRDPERPDQDISVFRIRFASGAEVVALPSVARALRGKQGLVILDEAAFMDDLDKVITAALALRMWGGKVVICSTHNGEANPFNGLIGEARAGKKPYHVERLTFDEAVAEGLYQRICIRTKKIWSPEAEAAWVAQIRAEYGDAAAEELDVIPSPTSGTWISGALLEARTIPAPVLRWTCPAGMAMWAEEARVRETRAWCAEHLAPVLAGLDPERAHVLGGDFGRVRDLSADWVAEIGRDLVKRPRLVMELRNAPHEVQRDIRFFLGERLPRFRAAKVDAGGNGSFLAEATQQKFGESRVEAVLFSEAWYRENMPRLRAGIEDGTFLLPKDDLVLDDFRMVKLVRGVPRVPDARRNDDRQPRHGDAAIAGALAEAASRADPEEYGYEPVPRLARALGDAGPSRSFLRAPDDEDDVGGPRALRGVLA